MIKALLHTLIRICLCALWISYRGHYNAGALEVETRYESETYVLICEIARMLRRRGSGPGGGRGKARTGKTTNLQGPIGRIYQPEQLDNFTGYAIVTINENVVKGYFPFLDMNFTYNLHCYLVNSYRGPEYEIESMGNPPYSPLPLTRERFISLLGSALNMPQHMAAEVYVSLERDPRLSDIDFTNMDPQKLLTRLAPTPDWLDRLAKQSLYFRYPFVKVLHRFWDAADLSGFDIQKLLKISAEFDDHPESFAYSWLNNSGLPELSFEKVQLAYRLQNKEQPRNLWQRMALYQNCKGAAERAGKPCISQDDLDEWGLRVEPAVAAKIIRPDGYQNPAKLNTWEHHYFLMPHWIQLQTVINGLRRLNARVLSPSLFLARPRNIGLAYSQLNAKQQFLVDSSRRFGFMIWNASAGTGKTTTALSSAAQSSRRSVMPVAYFGRVASNLRKIWTHGITIHRLYHLIKNETEQGETYKKYVRRVYIDEGSHVTLELFAMIFELPNLEQVIFMGDSAQMRPPSGVPIYESLIAFYTGTPVVQSLDDVMRVDRANADNAQILIENGHKIRDGNANLVFSREMLAENPFVIVPRIEVPGELYVIDKDKPEVRQKRVEMIKHTLRPVMAYLKNFQSYQMLALRHDTIVDMNMAISQILEEAPSNGFHQERVYKVGSKVMFIQNYYPPKPIKLPADPAKRRQTYASYEWRSRTTQVNTNEICTITAIVDLDPNTSAEVHVHDTSAPRSGPGFQRVLRLDDGGQVNLANIPLSRILRGDVSTSASSQGGEWDRIFLYMDARDCKPDARGSIMKRDCLYTIVTRAKQQVIIACRAPYDDLTESDIGVVTASERPPPDLILHKWFPPYEGQILQSNDVANADPDRTDVSGDDEDNNDAEIE